MFQMQGENYELNTMTKPQLFYTGGENHKIMLYKFIHVKNITAVLYTNTAHPTLRIAFRLLHHLGKKCEKMKIII